MGSARRNAALIIAVRAIVLTLEDLRAIDRHGVSKHGEQYKGWNALPPAGATSGTMDLDAAVMFLVSAAAAAGFTTTSHALKTDAAEVSDAYRASVKLLHPDHPTGNARDFHTLNEARRALDAHHRK